MGYLLMALTEKGLAELKDKYSAILAYVHLTDAALNCKDASDIKILEIIKECNYELVEIVNKIEYLDSYTGKPI